jgi:peptidoglycan glycosyltransferase
MNKQIRRLGLLFTIAFLALCLNLTYLQVWAASKIVSHPRNTRGIAKELSVERGQIVASDGLIIAESKRSGRNYQRRYPEKGLYAHLTGYYSLRYGRSGLERIYNEELLGKREISSLDDYLQNLMEGRERGHTIVLTIDSRLQKVASEALGNQRGAVVVLNPKTGEVLVMISNPSFNPNPLASLDPKVATRSWEGLSVDPQKPLINRAIQEWYPPGSTFKIVTTAAALESGIADPTTVFNCTGRLKLPLTSHTIRDFGGKSHGEISLEDALRASCNNTFGELGLRLGKDKLVYYSERFGINKEIPFELPVTESIIPTDLDAPSTALSAIGQKDVRITPLQMALISCAIANDGEIIKPHLVKEIRDYNGKIIREFESEKWLKAISSENASIMTEMLKRVVESGTGKAAMISGIEVAGKTGTAQVPNGAPHAWFTCFAPANDPQIAVAIVIENGGSMGNDATGGRIAAPIAREIMLEALEGSH